MRRALPLLFVLAVALSGGCTSFTVYERQECDTLYFGTQIPAGGSVSEAQWEQFLREEVTPRFPGFTHWEAHGEWKGTREETHVLQIIHPAGRTGDVAAIAAAYKKRFAQESVLQVRSDVWLPR